MHHPAHPGLAQEEEDFTGAIDDAGRLSDEDSEFLMLEDEEPEPSGSDTDKLRQMHAMVAPHAANATPEEIGQALEEVQNALLELLLEARTTKGHQGQKLNTLTNKELSVAMKEETICTYRRKYLAMHCLWVNSVIFPLCDDPQTDLYSSECWVSPLVIKDGVKSELFQFIPKEDHPLMAHCIFGDKFCHGIQCVHSEMVSNIKSTGGAIFGLLAEFFIRSFDRFKEPRCWKLLLSPNQKYTKFAPCLFPNFLKNVPSCLAFFGKSSLAGCNAPGPKPKAKLWSLQSTRARMVAGAAVMKLPLQPILILPRQWSKMLMTGSLHTRMYLKVDLQQHLLALHLLSNTSHSILLPPSCPPSPIMHAASHPAIPMANMHIAGVAGPRSILAAMQDLALENGCAPPPPPPLPSPPFDPGAVPEVESEEAPSARDRQMTAHIDDLPTPGVRITAVHMMELGPEKDHWRCLGFAVKKSAANIPKYSLSEVVHILASTPFHILNFAGKNITDPGEFPIFIMMRVYSVLNTDWCGWGVEEAGEVNEVEYDGEASGVWGRVEYNGDGVWADWGRM
ncbi:hypothetical protein EDC04DRAFT_2606150 [Pisolithus marmoratus]|nr:hypothetical protein EDC04DRAFT_2606150 [Pisolithus marmoratus]